MKQYLEIGSTPAEEDCVQIQRGVDYLDAMKKECNAFKHQLERQFPDPPGDAYFALKGSPHDFGTYYEVVVYYNDESEEEATFAYNVEESTPQNWDEEALKELGKSGKKYNHMLDVAFEVISPHKDWSDIPTSEILDAMQRRVDFLKAHPADAEQAFSCGDTHEEESGSENSESPKDIFPCSKCQTPTPIDLLDAKDDGTGNYTILECQKCYGPGWLPAIERRTK